MTAEERVIEYLDAHPEAWVTARELFEALDGASHSGITLALRVLYRIGFLEREKVVGGPCGYKDLGPKNFYRKSVPVACHRYRRAATS